ncbi:nucleoside-diphosphate-sugar epimerase [Pseudarthrobacter sp. PvP004]|uniref:SDR family oxidoreductase n=1 Tax=Pseudarthrobacter sp. PvP004 TaxID=2817850 RepID=UPI001AE37E13|nr:SDR family oxidoreductase [Pseudarthrobacter sp. PvP004]MBP2267088.1 nucleoside-diphosphate-sugar epimerase [Pseudarthrobacter sp. PvP004]
MSSRHALVFGATGHIGKWLVRELLQRGVTVTAAVRTEHSSQRLAEWLAKHDAGGRPTFVLVDFSLDDLGQDPASNAFKSVTEVHNVAGAFAFGMTAEAAYAANVTSAERVVRFAAKLPAVTRVVHLSGYRVGGQDPAEGPWDDSRRAKDYKRLGAYEGSKVESDAVVQATARSLGVPFTMVNPATVIGDSINGESGQVLGLATTVLDLFRGKLPVLPGNQRTFVPVVTADYLASFMALVPNKPEAENASYWVLDDATPPLPELLGMLGKHLNVRVPWFKIPSALLKKLPAKLTGADPETLSFLSEDRYPTAAAVALAEAGGLHHPPVETALKRWADYLVAAEPAAREDRVASM